MFGIDEVDELVEDRGNVVVIGGGGEVGVDKAKELKVEVLPLLYEPDERVHHLHLGQYRFLHDYRLLSMC